MTDAGLVAWLHCHKGDINRVARQTGLTRASIYSRVRRHDYMLGSLCSVWEGLLQEALTCRQLVGPKRRRKTGEKLDRFPCGKPAEPGHVTCKYHVEVRRREQARLRKLVADGVPCLAPPTPRQLQALRFIHSQALCPTIREICDHLGIKSLYAGAQLIGYLIRKGLVVKLRANTARALQVTQAGIDAANTEQPSGLG